MSTAQTLEVARRNLFESIHLQDDEFWREYVRIEDAALRCTEPEDHGAIMEGLSTYLHGFGEIPSVEEFI